jgi:hypothetical protein
MYYWGVEGERERLRRQEIAVCVEQIASTRVRCSGTLRQRSFRGNLYDDDRPVSLSAHAAAADDID